MDGIIAWAIDNLRNITFILTGSEIGVLRDFLKIEDPKAPLYGRYRREILVNKFSLEQSIDFLEKGFKELGKSYLSKELEETVYSLDGNPGWLTLYGYYRAVREMDHRTALKKVFEEGYKIVGDELEKIIAFSRKRYMAILKALSINISRWIDIKNYVINLSGNIDDKTFSRLLKKLVKYGYVVKRDGRYFIDDPILKKYILETV